MITLKDEMTAPEIPFELWSTPQWAFLTLVAITGLLTYAYIDLTILRLLEFIFLEEDHIPTPRRYISVLAAITLIGALLAAIGTALLYLPSAMPKHLETDARGLLFAMSPYLLTGVMVLIRAARFYTATSWLPWIFSGIPILAGTYGVITDEVTRQPADLGTNNLVLILPVVGSFLVLASSPRILRKLQYNI